MAGEITRLTDFLAVYNASGAIDDRDFDKEFNSVFDGVNAILKTVVSLSTTLTKGNGTVFVDPVGGIAPIVQIGDEDGNAIDILQGVKDSLVNLSGAITNISGTIPIGGTLYHNGTTAPDNFMVEDGSSLVRLEYPELFAKIGTLHGTADSTHFNIPYSLGLGIRGVDNGEGNDPDAGSRIASNPGGATGDSVGTYQGDQFKTHTHTVTYSTQNVGTLGGESINTASAGGSSKTSGSTGGTNQTNMRNVSKLPCIRYQ